LFSGLILSGSALASPKLWLAKIWRERGGVRRAMDAVAAEYGDGNAHRGGGWGEECHDVDVNFGHDVSYAWIFAVAPQFFNFPAGTHCWRGSHATA
jgi:hypothetical protein